MKMTKQSLLKVIGAVDDVISALAGTNDEVHKDETDKMVRLWDDLNDRYAPPEVVRELARMALAAMDSEPVAMLDVQSRRPDGNKFALVFSSAAHKLPDDVYFLYRHAQPAPVVPQHAEFSPAVITSCHECGSESLTWDTAVVSNTSVQNGRLKLSDVSGLFYLGCDECSETLARVDGTEIAAYLNACRAAMLQAGNCRENANSSTNLSREHFISLCNEFWNWSEMDEVCAEDRGYELRMEWDGKVFKHPVTQALWRMYQAAPQEAK
ncbi:TPA: hypothetical protein ACSRGI_003813 [Klebsiella variicola subsp. variicola]